MVNKTILGRNAITKSRYRKGKSKVISRTMTFLPDFPGLEIPTIGSRETQNKTKMTILIIRTLMTKIIAEIKEAKREETSVLRMILMFIILEAKHQKIISTAIITTGVISKTQASKMCSNMMKKMEVMKSNRILESNKLSRETTKEKILLWNHSLVRGKEATKTLSTVREGIS